MKLSIKIFFIAVTILIVLAGAAYLFIAFQGKAIIVKKLQDLTQKKVSMDYIGFSGPLNLEIKNLQIEGLLKADYVFISPSILGFFMGRVALDEVKIVKPELTFEKVPSQIPATAPAVGGGAPVQAKKRYTLPLIIKQIDIKDGRLDFIDRTVGTEGMKIIIKDISFHLDNLYIFPRSVVTNFKLQGKVPWQQEAEEGKIEFAGWINLLKRDMQATLRIEDIDGIHFYPYYSKWVDLEKSRIEKAKLNFNSDIQGLNNDITANCHLELTDIVFRPRTPEEEMKKAEKIATAVLDIFRALN
ncbi:MAG: DUF748 domain-containing protein, partial [Candidatus Omnitrophica bacterium]|nr:DUF748 domain-containing protein [Candidatus Omnitrophota bacterium]